MNGPYINPNGPEFAFVRGEAPWPKVLREAAHWAREMGDWDSVMVYDGIVKDFRISDDREEVHYDDDDCADSQGKQRDDPTFVPCCRTAEVYAFRVAER